MYYLGTCYENGLGVDKDDHKAAELYEQASKGGQMDATINLAVFYWHGRGGVAQVFHLKFIKFLLIFCRT